MLTSADIWGYWSWIGDLSSVRLTRPTDQTATWSSSTGKANTLLPQFWIWKNWSVTCLNAPEAFHAISHQHNDTMRNVRTLERSWAAWPSSSLWEEFQPLHREPSGWRGRVSVGNRCCTRCQLWDELLIQLNGEPAKCAAYRQQVWWLRSSCVKEGKNNQCTTESVLLLILSPPPECDISIVS